MTAPPRYRATHLDDLEAVTEGHLTRVAVRRALGIDAFGINAFIAAAAGDELIEEHDELGGAAGHHQELYIVLRGRASFTLDGKAIDAPAGAFVYCADPAVKRHAVAAEDDTVAVVIAGTSGEAYRPSPWDLSAAALESQRAGDLEGALRMMRETLVVFPGNNHVLYNLACVESLSGETDDAIAHLNEAIGAEPKLREYVAGDSDLDPIRADPRFPR